MIVDRGGVAVAATVRSAVLRVGGGFMGSPEAKHAQESVGLSAEQFCLTGRCGVLGPVPAEVVVSAVGFCPPSAVHERWTAAVDIAPPAQVSRCLADGCAAWGRRCFADLLDAARLADLLEKVVDHAPLTGLPLFAGWRARPRPEDPAARVAHLIHLLREHRLGAQLVAIVATGLTPLQAMLAGRHGEANARLCGWPEPYEVVTDRLRAAYARAEDVTDQVTGAACEVLSDAERMQLRELLHDACQLAFPIDGAPPQQGIDADPSPFGGSHMPTMPARTPGRSVGRRVARRRRRRA